MTDDAQDGQAQPRRAPPREPSQLREGLAAAENALGVRRVAPAQPSNDGNLTAERSRQAAAASRASNDGKFVQTPAVRERRVPSDPGRTPPPPASGIRSGLPRSPAKGITTSNDSSRRDSFPSETSGRTAEPWAAQALRQASGTEASVPPGGAVDISVSEQPSAFRDGVFVGIGNDADWQGGRNGQEGDFAERDDMEFEPMPSPDDIVALSGRTGPEAPPAEPASGDPDLVEMAEPGSGATLAKPKSDAPMGPDYDHKRLVVQALERAVAQQRLKRRQVAGIDDSSSDDGEDPQRMSGLLQSAKTHAGYLKRGKQHLTRYKRENGVQFADEDVDPRKFVAWLIGLKPFLSKSSWRTYRLAATAVIQSIPHDGIDEAIAALTADSRIEEDARVVYKKTVEKSGGNTSSVRAKRMDLVHFRKLRSNLRRMSRSNKVDWLDDWLVAGIHTGLRPGEWPLAHLEVRREGNRRLAWLHVVNAKATHGRANGTHRTLDISTYTDATLDAIQRMVKRSEQWALEGKTVRRQADVAQLFYQICDELFPRMQVKYSLYSLRHQFIANMKAVYNDPAKVATLIGHISVETQSEHYAKRRSSWGLHDIVEIPRPMEDQVAQVQQYLVAFEERSHLRMMRKAFADGRDLMDVDEEEIIELELANDMGPGDHSPETVGRG